MELREVEEPNENLAKGQGAHENVQNSGEHRRQTFAVTVNEQPVTLLRHISTGFEIKAAAIAQGVQIQPNFVLQEELPNGTSRIIGDQDEMHWREHLRFTALAPDDN